jgi:hypothetical protein
LTTGADPEPPVLPRPLETPDDSSDRPGRPENSITQLPLAGKLKLQRPPGHPGNSWKERRPAYRGFPAVPHRTRRTCPRYGLRRRAACL